MNGFKRASRQEAAVVGLAMLLGASFLGCHSGPRLFSRKDRDERADKRELAEKDKDKFVNRKKVRPESEYLDSDRDLEQVAKNASKPKAKSTDSARSRQADDDRRVAAVKPRAAQPETTAQRPSKSAPQTTSNKTSNEADVVKRDATKRPAADLWDETLFDDPLPSTRLTAKSAQKANTTARPEPVDADPFRNVVVRPPISKRPKDTVARVNFDDPKDAEEEAEEDEEEREEQQLLTQKKPVKKSPSTTASNSSSVTAEKSSDTSNRKFLPDNSQEEIETTFAAAQSRAERTVASASAKAAQAKRELGSDAKSAISNKRENINQTINDWQRDLEGFDDPKLSEGEVSVAPSFEKPKVPTNGPRIGEGSHLSEVAIDEFPAPKKSQGAVLNGDLIIDTTNLPSRFQRHGTGIGNGQPANSAGNSSGNGSRRMNSNSGASIEIVPGTTQLSGRSSGQISLQSNSVDEQSLSKGELEPAVYETTSDSASADLGGLPSFDSEAGSLSNESPAVGLDGPRLSTQVGGDQDIAPVPPTESSTNWNPDETVSSGLQQGWKKIFLAIGSAISAVLIGLGWRRRRT